MLGSNRRSWKADMQGGMKEYGSRNRQIRMLAALLVLLCLFSPSVFYAQNPAPSLGPASSSSIESAREAARRGEALRRKWELAEAEMAFRQAAAADPANLEALVGLARIAQARFDYAGAKLLLDRAASVHPRSPEPPSDLGMLYLAAEEPGRALDYFERALKLDPSSEQAMIGLAGVALVRRDYAGAQSRLREHISRNPRNGRAHAMLARVLLEMNKNDEAEASAQRAVEIDAYDVDALQTLAFIKAADRKPEAARSFARRALAMDPTAAGARRLLSQYLDGRAGYEQKVSSSAHSHYERGQALKREGMLDEAVIEFEAALALEPRYYRALIALADIWMREGDPERAATAARLALALDADASSAHMVLSYALLAAQERARTEIGGVDFAALYYSQPAAPVYGLTAEIFPNYRTLTRRQQMVIDRAVAPFAAYLPKLASRGARHYLLAFDQRVSEIKEFDDVAEDRTFDGRYYASIRGVGGKITVSGIEYIDLAARGGFHTIAHEFAHQVHMTALEKNDVKEVRRLYEQARREGRTLDYYAAANEYEYFAQGYEAFISERKRPAAGVTARHTRDELIARDPDLFRLLLRLTSRTPSRDRR
ncbi:MAG TPA: tetratricopeptide repeat protein [Blastocatellia bacterium]|nr:tetratricopeptide repeat protein [Blastocatellia bacterium]